MSYMNWISFNWIFSNDSEVKKQLKLYQLDKVARFKIQLTVKVWLMTLLGLNKETVRGGRKAEFQPSQFSAVIGRPGSTLSGRPITALN